MRQRLISCWGEVVRNKLMATLTVACPQPGCCDTIVLERIAVATLEDGRVKVHSFNRDDYSSLGGRLARTDGVCLSCGSKAGVTLKVINQAAFNASTLYNEQLPISWQVTE